MTSSSSVIADSPVWLTVAVLPSTVMLANGGLVVYFPDYYENSGSDQMVTESNPTCTGYELTVSQCTFNTAFRQLSLSYRLNSGIDSTGEHYFNIGSFQNPVKPGSQSGFVVMTTDELGYTIGESNTISLDGVTQSDSFSYVSFSFDDNPYAGQYSIFRINIGLRGSIGRQCFVKVIFPEDFTIDNELIAVSGTNFLQQSSGSSHTLLEKNDSTRTIVFEAC